MAEEIVYTLDELKNEQSKKSYLVFAEANFIILFFVDGGISR